MSHNIILIGMPGCGKTTVGRLIAQKLGFSFIDTDDLIIAKSGLSLQQLIDRRGRDAFMRLEERTLQSLRCANCVVATGGSAIYSMRGMRHLAENGLIAYLQASLLELHRRIGATPNRGILCDSGQTFDKLYLSREPLYMQFADIVVTSRGKPQGVADLLIMKLRTLDRHCSGKSSMSIRSPQSPES